MPITQTYDLDNAENFNLTNTQISGNAAKLALVPNPLQNFSNSFTDDTGFTYDNTKAEFSGGLIRQKDLRPAGSSFHANYNLGFNANWGTGGLTATNNGGALNAGKLELLGGISTKYVDYDASGGNADSLQVGCVRIRVVPNYTGTPATNNFFFRICQASGSGNNVVGIHHTTAGFLAIRIFNNAGGTIISANAGAWSPIAGQEYELELNWDITTGATRLFVDGVLSGATFTQTGTRSGAVGLLRIGESHIPPTGEANFSVNNFLIFPTVQHTGAYTPSAFEADYIYAGSKVDGPTFIYSGVGTLISLDDGEVTEIGTPRYILTGKFWNGSSWATSNGSYAEANTFATAISNFAALDIEGETNLSWSVVFPDSNNQSSADEISIEFTGQKYPLTGHLEPTNPIEVFSFVSYSQTATEGPNSSIRVALKIDGTLKYWNGLAWVISNGTAAQANTAAEINANLSSLDLGANATVFIRWILSTSEITETAELDAATIGFNFGGVSTSLNTCIIYGYLRDITNNPIAGATISFQLNQKSSEYGEANKNLLSTKVVSTPTDSNGYLV